MGQEHYPLDNVVVVVTQKYKPWMMRPQVFMGIHVCSLAKQIQRSFDKSLHCHEILVQMQTIPKVLPARHAFVVVCLPRKLFMSYLMIFKCAFVICLCSLIVDICYVSRTGEAVSLPPFSLIHDFSNQNTRWNVSKISVNHTRHHIWKCYRYCMCFIVCRASMTW